MKEIKEEPIFKATKSTKKEVSKYFDKMLMHQYRSEKYNREIYNKLDDLIGVHNDRIVGYLNVHILERATSQVNKRYKDYIKPPKPTIKNRIRYLFFGKL